jgi:KOW motif-containing protein
MRAWAGKVAARLSELGLDSGASLREDLGPTRVLLARSETGGDASRARIALLLDEEHVEVAVELFPSAVPAARARIADPVQALELTTAFEALPEQFAMGLAGDSARAPASRASTDQIRGLLDRAEGEARALWLGWSIPREVALAHAALLEEQLEDAVVALVSVFTMLARAPPDAGAASPGRPASARRDKRDRPGGDDERRGAKRRAREREDATSSFEQTGEKAAGAATARSGRDPKEPERERDGELAGESDSRENSNPTRRAARAASVKAQVRAGVRTRWNRGGAGVRKDGASAGGAAASGSKPRPVPRPVPRPLPLQLERGARVRVLEGPFSGKVGVVQEIDGKGGARVMLGLLAVRVDVRDLARCADGRHRPLLSTSHRKPPPVRS